MQQNGVQPSNKARPQLYAGTNSYLMNIACTMQYSVFCGDSYKVTDWLEDQDIFY